MYEVWTFHLSFHRASVDFIHGWKRRRRDRGGRSQRELRQGSGLFNRLHPEIPMVATADPGERIVFLGRDAFDLTLDPDKFASAKSIPREGFGIVHALTGPVFIKGAEVGDVLAVTIEAMEPDKVGWTKAGPFGFAGDEFGTDERFIVWRINEDAVSDALPGVRIPNASFPGVVTTLPAKSCSPMCWRARHSYSNRAAP